MLQFFAESDCGPATGASWLNDRIVMLISTRDDSFLNTTLSSNKTWIKNTDGDTSGTVYNHYVPYNRIFNQIKKEILTNNMTRGDLLRWLVAPKDAASWQPLRATGFVISDLAIQPMDLLVAEENGQRTVVPIDNLRAWTLWVNWAIWAICNWKENMFLGPGTGDAAAGLGKGSAIDKPTSATKGAAQLVRLQAAAAKLKKHLPSLDVTGNLKIEDKVFDWSTAWLNKDSQMKKMTVNYINGPVDDYTEVDMDTSD